MHLIDMEEDSRYIEMYLHRKFYDSVDSLKVSQKLEVYKLCKLDICILQHSHCRHTLSE